MVSQCGNSTLKKKLHINLRACVGVCGCVCAPAFKEIEMHAGFSGLHEAGCTTLHQGMQSFSVPDFCQLLIP